MPVTDPAPPLAADDLHVRLGGSPILRGVGLSVGAGESVALLGGNGSGKSTLLRACLGLVPIQSGTVELFGTPLARFRQWRSIGYVPQHSTGTLRGATVAEVVGSGRMALRTPFVPAGPRHRAAVDRSLRRVDLQQRRHDEISTLSGGQQQRALIARALVSEPDLLVLDEPTAGVDLHHQGELADTLAGLLDNGRALLVVLHEIGPLAPLIQRTVRLRDGLVADPGTGPDESDPACHEPDTADPGGAFGLPGDTLAHPEAGRGRDGGSRA